jgi:photosystem II stability/assembly factor-like uncharacterized protein
MRAKHVLPALIVLLLAAPLAALPDVTPGKWRRLGPEGGELFGLAVAPGNPNVVYATSQGTIYRSLNGGATWTLVNGEQYSYELTVDAANPFLVYESDGDVFRSLDGGATWAMLDGPGYPYAVRQVAAHPRYAKTVFAVTTGGLFRSADAGLHWKAVRGGLPNVFEAFWIVIDPVSPRRMYLLTGDDTLEVFYKSLDGGYSWQPMDNSFIPAGDFVTALATHPRSSRTLYMAASNAVYKSTDGGAAWKATGAGLEGWVETLLIPPGRSDSVYAGTTEGLFLSLDGGATWARQSQGLALPGDVSLLVASGQTLLALGYGAGRRSGVFRSRDGGRSWAFSSRGIFSTEVTVVEFGAPGTIWCVADFNLFRSTDDGLTWRRIQTDPASPRVPVQVAVDPTDRSNVFVIDSDGAFWRSGDAGATWEPGGPAGNAGLKVYDLVVDPQTPSILYAAGARGIAKSTDRGDTWTLLSAEPAKYYYEVHIAPSSPSTLYAAAGLGNLTWLLQRSTDAGATWTRMNFENEGVIETSLAVDPLVATTVYAADNGYIYRSTDGGNTWSEFSDLVNSNTAYPLAISDTGRLYSAEWDIGVVSYADGNPAGQVLGRFLPWPFNTLALDPHDPCRVFGGPWAQGLLVFRHTGIPGCPAP